LWGPVCQVGVVVGAGVGCGLAGSAFSNRKELRAIYSKAYVEALSHKLPNLIYNLGVVLGAEKATCIADELGKKLTHKAVQLSEEKAAEAFIETIAQLIANQIGVNPEILEAVLDEVAKEPLLDSVKKGRESRSAKLWNWTKKMSSPLKLVLNPIIYSWGTVYANKMEKSGKLRELTCIIKSQVHPGSVKDHRSMNPFNAGLLAAVRNVFFNFLSLIASISGNTVGKVADYTSDGIYLFEEAVNKTLQEKTGNQYDLKGIAKIMGLNNLTEKRYQSCLTSTLEASSKAATDFRSIKFSNYSRWF